MLRPFTDIKNFALAARDGEIGKVKELYFDDQNWAVRYAVVDTGGWLTGRRVLLAPRSFGAIDAESGNIVVHLTKEQIENSPSIDADKPVSRQHEEEWHNYYGYPGYWLAPEAVAFSSGPTAAEIQARIEAAPLDSESGDPHLRSTNEVAGYAIHARDGDIGTVDDFIVDDDGWTIRYVVISKSWWPGKKVVISPKWIDQISWDAKQVSVPLTRETIKGAPEWDGAEPISRALEEQLFDYYGTRGYWAVEA